MTKELPTPMELRKLLRYEPETGQLFWRERDAKMFSDGYHSADAVCQRWNTQNAGRVAFCGKRDGYFFGQIFGMRLKAHRVAYAVYYGEWPINNIDHINGDPLDNRIENLRDVTQAENTKNTKISKHNKSGVNGVYWNNKREKFQARLTEGGMDIHLGLFASLEEAAAARAEANKKYGFTDRHGLAEG